MARGQIRRRAAAAVLHMKAHPAQGGEHWPFVPARKPPPRRLSAAACGASRRRCTTCSAWPIQRVTTSTSEVPYARRAAAGPSQSATCRQAVAGQQGLPMPGVAFSVDASGLEPRNRLTSRFLWRSLVLRNGRASFRVPLTRRSMAWRQAGQPRNPNKGTQPRGVFYGRPEPLTGVRSISGVLITS